ncbi:MAG: sporulation protein YunB [Vallitaleaceae bacterium]|nr:sporulation protein YunB [Vallitaleaceae bacterium]
MKARRPIRHLFGHVPIMKGHRPRKKRRRFQATLIWTLFFVLIILCFRYVENEMMPTLLAVSNMRIQTVSNEIISKAIDETFRESNINTDDLATFYFNEEGSLISFGVNTVLVNEISAAVMEKISIKVREYQGDELYIPLGRMTGSNIFSSMGPKIKVKIMPYGTTTIHYDSAFVSEGINQINHRIWLNVEMTMQVVAPLNKTQTKVNQTVTLVDRVINGNVPDQYINVPKDEVLNVVK